MRDLSSNRLRGQGEGRTPRQCPNCESKDGRVGMGQDENGNWKRGWLCFACGYFPSKDPKQCLLNKKISELDAARADKGLVSIDN